MHLNKLTRRERFQPEEDWARLGKGQLGNFQITGPAHQAGGTFATQRRGIWARELRRAYGRLAMVGADLLRVGLMAQRQPDASLAATSSAL
jgi:hypothetical protein